MNIHYSTHFISQYKKVIKKNKYLAPFIEKKIQLFITDKNHPSLRLHKLEGNLRDDWSFSIEQNLRIIFTYAGNQAIFYDIGSHDEVYK